MPILLAHLPAVRLSAGPLTVFVKALCALPILFFLPGYVTLRALRTSSCPQRASEDLYLSVLTSVLVISPPALLLADLGWFSLWSMCALSAAYVCLLLWFLVRRGRALLPSWLPPDKWEVGLLALVVVAALLFARPHEYVLGGSDAGAYLSMGANLAKTGGLIIDDPLVAATPPEAWALFFRQHSEASAVDWSRYPAFFIDAPDQGRVVPQFVHLHPVWMGLLYSVGGVWGELYLAPLWAILGGVSVYLATAAVFGRRSGLGALLVLTICALQIWFARYPTSETLTQFLFYGATFATIRFLTHPRGQGIEYGLAAGLGWGCLLLVRLDGFFLLAVPGLILALLLLNRRWEPRHWWFALPWVLVTVQAALHAILIAHAYAHDTFQGVFWALNITWGRVALAAGAVFAALAILYLFPARWQRLSGWIIKRQRTWSSLLGAIILLSALYGYLVRPQVEAGQTYYYWYSDDTIESVNHENLVRLGWYLSPLGLTLGVGGIAYAWWRRLNRWSLLLLGPGVLQSFLYVYDILNNPHQVYAMRRYVPAVVPTLVIGAAVLLNRAWSRARRRPSARAGVLLVGCLLLGQLLWVDHLFAFHVDNRGLTAQVAELALRLPEETLVLFSDSSPVGWGDLLGTPLSYLHGRQVMTLRQQQPEQTVLSDQLRAWQAAGRQIMLIPGARPVLFHLPDWSLEPAGEYLVSYRALESSYTHMPQEILEQNLALEFYQVVPRVASIPTSLPYRIDVGQGDMDTLVTGFYAREHIGGRDFRWTMPEATISLPRGAILEAASLWLNVAASRPNVAPVHLELLLDGQEWTTVMVGNDFATYHLRLPNVISNVPTGTEPEVASRDSVFLTLRSAGWNPRDSGLGGDNRELGVMLDWIELAIDE